MQAPAAETLSECLSRIPIVCSVAILSPHGFFGQKDVLGKPDTGGQVSRVVFILHSNSSSNGGFRVQGSTACLLIMG